jgi:hypothetical protein
MTRTYVMARKKNIKALVKSKRAYKNSKKKEATENIARCPKR